MTIELKPLGDVSKKGLDKRTWDFLNAVKHNILLLSGQKGTIDNKYVSFKDLDSLVFPDSPQYVEVANIDDPAPELLSKSSTANAGQLIAYQIGTEYEYTIYNWSDLTGGVSSPYIVGGNGGVWVAVAGRYVNSEMSLTKLSTSRLLYGDSNKDITSVSDLTAWVAGIADQITVTDDLDGTVTLSVDEDYLSTHIIGTTNQINVTISAVGEITLSTPQDIHTGASPTFAGLIIDSDINGVLFGDGQDAKVYYDGTVLNINTSVVAASDLDITCGANKTLRLVNTVYNDLQFPLSGAKVPASNAPTWETFTTNTNEYSFAVDDYIDTEANECPHGWELGTAGEVHMHITTKAANTSGSDWFAKFTVYIAYCNGNGSSTWQETNFTAELTIPDGTPALSLRYLDMGNVDLTGFILSSEIKVRAKRITATGGTEYSGNIFITQVGVHLKNDTIGSRQEAVK